jgi:hypothetical protein
MNPPSTGYPESADNKLCKLLCCFDGLFIPPPCDCPRYPPGASLLTILKDQIGQLALGEVVNESRGSQVAGLIHSHVERRVGLETKASFVSLEL